ncbi:hypothetical protein IGI04_029564 [Brassica rapa subsp. trilocularis]|uniref:Uncharacterized protein n=1 Tax=Brassica rapa subsp. trilocularis TaxID=1813537 RepID=A0ABQ7LN80_BRACM|nr:hypothetical protein IGI04_029564 [Brassica rapa subsp. trilocularis]
MTSHLKYGTNELISSPPVSTATAIATATSMESTRRLTITSQTELRFRLIHFWESRNITKGRTFIGLELLQCDEQGIVVHFLRSCSMILASSKAETTYSLLNFYASRNKEIYRVTDQMLDDISLFIDGKRLGSTLMTISKGLSSGSKGGPVKIYLWHQAAKDFYK